MIGHGCHQQQESVESVAFSLSTYENESHSHRNRQVKCYLFPRPRSTSQAGPDEQAATRPELFMGSTPSLLDLGRIAQTNGPTKVPCLLELRVASLIRSDHGDPRLSAHPYGGQRT